jgi:hypothetical protein
MSKSTTRNGTDSYAEERKAAAEVMRLQRELVASNELKYTGDYVYEKVSWRDTDRSKDPVTGKLGVFGKKGNHDVRRIQIDANGEHKEQFVYRKSSRDCAYFPVPAKYLNLMMVDEDGTTRMKNPGGGKCTAVDLLKNFGRFIKASATTSGTPDLSIPGGDDEIIMLSLCFGFSVVDDLEDEENPQMEYLTAMSYNAASGADSAWAMWGAFGISCGVVQTKAYGEKVKLCPTAVVDGAEHQFNIAVTPTPRKTHQAGQETYEEKVRLTKKRMAIELPQGVEGIKESMNTSFVGFFPIMKLAPLRVGFYGLRDLPAPPVPVPVPVPVSMNYARIYGTYNAVTGDFIYSRRRSDGVFFHAGGVSHAANVITVGAPALHMIRNYVMPVVQQYAPTTQFVTQTLPVVGMTITTPVVPGINYGLSGITGVLHEEVEEEDDGDALYRSASALGAKTAPKYRGLSAAAPAPGAVEVEEDVDEEGEDDAVLVDAPAPAADDTPETVTVPVPAGEKRPADDMTTTSEASASERAETNIHFGRQSRAAESCGKAPKIVGAVKRNPEGRPVVDQFFNMVLKKGKLPTKQDLLDFDELVGKVHKAVEALTGKKEHKLSDAYSQMIGATSVAPLPTKTKIDIAATRAALSVGAPTIAIPMDLF